MEASRAWLRASQLTARGRPQKPSRLENTCACPGSGGTEMLLPYLKSCRELRADPKQKEQSISQEPNCGCWRSTDYCSPVRATRFQRQYSPDGGAHFGGRLLHCWLSGLTCTPSPHPARVGDTGALLWSSLPAHLPFPSCGHSSQGSPQPSPGILLQQHRALVVLKALGTEHFPLSKRVKQKLWRVSA